MNFKLAAALAAIIGLGAAQTAVAADLPARPVYKAPAAMPLAYNWSGFYIGANIGYGWGDSKSGLVDFYDPAFAGSIPGHSYDMNGVIGGGQIGYNQQFGNTVFGLEADFSGTGMKGSVTDPVFGYTATSSIDWLSTVRGRLGLTFDRSMVYATGGVAIGRVKNKLDDIYGADVITTTSTTTHVGWTIGAGIETVLSPNWSVRAEYLYVDLGSENNNHYEPNPPGWSQISYDSSVTASIARVGVNYKF
jgi:outer membrane immunogenic protein